MSNSYKKPYVQCSNQIDKDKDHKRLRHIVKMELKKDNPDINIIEGDTRSLGFEEHGTTFGMDVSEIIDEQDEEFVRKNMRK